MEGLIAPLNPRLMVSQSYLTLKGGLRADIKGGRKERNVSGFRREKSLETTKKGKPS